MQTRLRVRWSVLVGSLFFGVVARAQQPPSLGYVFPPGGRAGTTVDVRLGGYDWTPDMQFFVDDSRIKLELLGPPSEILVPPPPYWFGPKGFGGAMPLPRELPARLTIPAGVPSGPVRWRVANANGASNAGLFHVGAYPQIVEIERRTEPQALSQLPVTVCGRIAKIEEVDRYRFTATRDGPVTCALKARRLGANFHGVLEVHDAAGRLIADAVDTEGNDPILTFPVKTGGQYTISVRDLDFYGDWSFVYRLDITPGPRILATIPAAGRRGETRPIEFIGIGLATGQAKLESVNKTVSFLANATTSSFSYRLETPHGKTPAFSLLVSDLKESIASGAQPQRIEAPAAVTGALDNPSAEARYLLDTKKGQVWDLAVQARKLGSPLDVSLAVLGPDGKELARNDDLPSTTDAGLSFTVPADGTYQLVVSDMSGKSGSRAAIYRLVVDRPASDFRLHVAAPLLNLPLGGTASLQVTATRFGDFKEPIALEVKGLPTRVTVPDKLVIPANASALEIKLQSAKDAPAQAAVVQIVGSATIGGKTRARAAQAVAAGSLAARSPEENLIDSVLVATTMKPRCKVTPVDKDGGRRVHRGATHPAELIIERLEGFQGEINLWMASAQSRLRQGITGPELTVPSGLKQIAYPCFMPEWLETARTSRMAVVGVVKTPDPKGNLRYVMCPVNGQITMSIEGALLKITHAAQEPSIRPGQILSVPFKIARSPKLTDPVTVEVRFPEELGGALKAQPLTLTGKQTEAQVQITASPDLHTSGWQAVTLRASAKQAGKWDVVSDASVEIELVAADRKTAQRR